MFNRKVPSDQSTDSGTELPSDTAVPPQSEAELNRIAAWLERIARGDLTGSETGTSPLFGIVSAVQERMIAIASELAYSSSCIGKSSKSMNRRSEQMRDRVAAISSHISDLEELSSSMSLNMSTVASATEELSINMKDIAAAALDNRDFAAKIADSTEQFAVSARTIVEHSERAAIVTGKARTEAFESMARVESLETATREIGAVTETIAEISEQTKLLALNATIEAARAGVAGRGFAVVAKEVKELALQTNSATVDIREKIDAIQEESRRTIDAIGSIRSIIEEVAGVVDTIARSSQEQSGTFRELKAMTDQNNRRVEQISDNVKMGASAVSDVNVTLNEVSMLSQRVASAISEMHRETASIASASVANYALALESSGQGGYVASLLKQLTVPSQIMTIGETAHPELCRYTDSFSVSVTQFDTEHKKIFAMINEVHRLVKEENTGESLLKVLRELASFCVTHFDHEEIAMRQFSYPEYDSHKKIHEALLAKVTDLLNAAESGVVIDLIGVLQFLKEWLYAHINGVDKRYSTFLNENGLH